MHPAVVAQTPQCVHFGASSRIGSCAQVISFIGDAELNVGHISLIISQLTRLLEPVRQKINTDI
jgi:hypothetical protein